MGDPSTPAAPRAAQPSWTFLSNHAHVLLALHRDPEARIRDVAAEVGITERAVLKILRELEEDGYLSHERVGRRNVYHLTANRPLRHPLEAHRSVADLLDLIFPRR